MMTPALSNELENLTGTLRRLVVLAVLAALGVVALPFIPGLGADVVPVWLSLSAAAMLLLLGLVFWWMAVMAELSGCRAGWQPAGQPAAPKTDD
jgi:amino acid transporter